MIVVFVKDAGRESGSSSTPDCQIFAVKFAQTFDRRTSESFNCLTSSHCSLILTLINRIFTQYYTEDKDRFGGGKAVPRPKTFGEESLQPNQRKIMAHAMAHKPDPSELHFFTTWLNASGDNLP